MAQIRINNKLITYSVTRRPVKHPRLEMKSGNLVVVAPERMMDVEPLLKKYSGWIGKKHSEISAAIDRGKSLKLARRDFAGFKAMVERFIRHYSKQIGLEPANVFYKDMRSKWASCSGRGNISVNKRMAMLPEHLISYIICHEMTHLVVKNHGKDFYKALGQWSMDYKNAEKELMEYWFAIRGMNGRNS